MYKFNGNNFLLLEYLIYDATLTYSSIFSLNNSITIPIYRPDYRRHILVNYFIMKITKVFGTYSNIVIKDFNHYSLKWKDGVVQNKEYNYPIYQMDFNITSNRLNFITESFVLEIELNGYSTLELNDIKETNNVFLRIKGDKINIYNNWLNE